MGFRSYFRYNIALIIYMVQYITKLHISAKFDKIWTAPSWLTIRKITKNCHFSKKSIFLTLCAVTGQRAKPGGYPKTGTENHSEIWNAPSWLIIRKNTKNCHFPPKFAVLTSCAVTGRRAKPGDLMTRYS